MDPVFQMQICAAMHSINRYTKCFTKQHRDIDVKSCMSDTLKTRAGLDLNLSGLTPCFVNGHAAVTFDKSAQDGNTGDGALALHTLVVGGDIEGENGAFHGRRRRMGGRGATDGDRRTGKCS